MSSGPSKRVETEASRVQTTIPGLASTPEDLALQLRSVGSRIRKTVTEGYSVPSSPSKSQARTTIFTSANDILRDVYGSASPAPLPPSPKKRPREEDTDQDNEESMAVDKVESEGEMEIILETRDKSSRPVKPKPKRSLLQTRSLPAVFGSQRGLPSQQEPDWSLDNSTPSLRSFEPMKM
ncbi:hypothetical protein R3P38DRAFT_671030 [Favolaschia claudopus]|uniref:Uncharacterized protein n=1 Tax=Favolaschia claudopus TaxID=2862362 RepID=A0AAW0EDE8_9AGAR